MLTPLITPGYDVVYEDISAWANSSSMSGYEDEPVERGVLVRRWAKKRGVGMYHPAILGAPALTWEQTEHEWRVRKGWA